MQDSGASSSVGGRSAAAASKNGGAAWPKAWEPTGHESAVRLDPSASFSLLALPKYGGSAGAGDGGGLAEGLALPKFDEEVRIALLETLRFAQLSDDEYHAVSPSPSLALPYSQASALTFVSALPSALRNHRPNPSSRLRQVNDLALLFSLATG